MATTAPWCKVAKKAQAKAGVSWRTMSTRCSRATPATASQARSARTLSATSAYVCRRSPKRSAALSRTSSLSRSKR
jgi:hypothetical protein